MSLCHCTTSNKVNKCLIGNILKLVAHNNHPKESIFTFVISIRDVIDWEDPCFFA